MWANPPWSLLGPAVDKIMIAPSWSIVVCPDWSRPWLYSLKSAAVDTFYIPKGNLVFEVQDHLCNGTRWGTWAFLIGPRDTRDVRMAIDQGSHWSKSQRRKWRRKCQKKSAPDARELCGNETGRDVVMDDVVATSSQRCAIGDDQWLQCALHLDYLQHGV